MNYWYILWSLLGFLLGGLSIIFMDFFPHNASRLFINILDTASKSGIGDMTIDELLRKAELVDLDIWIKRRK